MALGQHLAIDEEKKRERKRVNNAIKVDTMFCLHRQSAAGINTSLIAAKERSSLPQPH
jgi:hypothetical protein